MKTQRIISALVIALALLINSFGSASAKPNDPPVVDTGISKQEKCLFSPLKPTGPAPMAVTFYADYNGPDVKFHSWLFSDGTNTDSAGGSVVDHTFTGTNTDPQIIHQVWFTDGTNFTCSSWGKITVPNQAVAPAVTQTPPAPPVDGNTSSPATGAASAVNTVTGNNNASNAINCYGNCPITVNNYPPTTVQPAIQPTAGQDALLNAIANFINWLIK